MVGVYDREHRRLMREGEISAALAEKDREIAQRDAELACMDEALARRDEELMVLRRRLAQLGDR